jgi:hypothetical protein
MVGMTGILALPAAAQTVYAPVPVTGFTADVVANGAGPANTSTTADMDGGQVNIRYCYLASTFVSPTGAVPISSLPATGLINSQSTFGLNFQLAPYTGLNSLRIPTTGPGAPGTGTLTLTTPRAARNIFVLAASGNRDSQVDVLVTFTDQSIQLFQGLTVEDWYDGFNNIAIMGVSRVNYDNSVIEDNTTNPRLYHLQLPLLPGNYGKLIQRLTFNKTSSQGTLNIMAVSMGVGCPSAPAPGRAVASQTSLCAPASINLSLSGAATDPDLTYQWQASTNNGSTWTDLAGATRATHSVTPSVSTQYRNRLTCGVQTSTSIPVAVTLTQSTSSLVYGPPAYCRTGFSPVPVVSPAGGRFTGTAGLVIDPITGVVDLGQSTPGAHVITYATTGVCPTQATSALTINAIDVAALAYDNASFCQAGSSRPPTASPAGGRFTGTAGLSLDLVTGVVSLGQSTPGLHTITYISAGLCPSQAQTSIQIEAAAQPAFTNIITRNGDGLNDQLHRPLPAGASYEVQVYNRWGRQVWESHDPSQVWNGQGVGVGLYFYRAQLADCTGQAQTFKGWVEVVE